MHAEPRPLIEIWPADAGPAPALAVTGVTARSQHVTPGALFVAVRGTEHDGHRFVPDALARGAAAVVVEEGSGVATPADSGVPTLHVPNSRRLLAQLAAAWHHHPATRLRLVGITGTVGKTTVLTMLEAALLEADAAAGVIGSLGLRIRGTPHQATAHTSPDALLLHYWLARLVEEHCSLAAMEVTSHALVQERVHGLRFQLGIFTNLIPLEHAEFHGSFRGYIRAKQRFLDHLDTGAPLIYNAEDRAVRRLVHASCGVPIGCGASRTALVRVQHEGMDAHGTRLQLRVRRPLPRIGGGDVDPLELPLALPLLGRANTVNAALAATAALCLGVDAAHVARSFARLRPARRRMEIVHAGEFMILDDTTGHPESVTAVFEVVQALAPRRVHIAFVVRGRRGTRINAQLGEALAIWAARVPPATLVVSRASDTADERNRVTAEEHAALRAPLLAAGLPFREMDRLEDAVAAVLEPARPGDLVLLLGAQGMDPGQQLARSWLASR